MKSTFQRNDSSSNAPSTINGRKPRKAVYEKLLSMIDKELMPGRSNDSGWNKKKTRKSKLNPAEEIHVMEHKCFVLVKLKRYKDIIEEGYDVLEYMGPMATVYKCVLVGMIRLGRNEEDVTELLEDWNNAIPTCHEFRETHGLFIRYLAARREYQKGNITFNKMEYKNTIKPAVKGNKTTAGADANKLKSGDTSGKKRQDKEGSYAQCVGEMEQWISKVETLEEKNRKKILEILESKNSTQAVAVAPAAPMEPPASASKQSQNTNNELYDSMNMPPLCVRYLQEMAKKIKEATSIKALLTEEIPGVTIKASPQHLQRRIDGTTKIQCLWTFLVTSKAPLRTVSILHDTNREFFQIASAFCHNKQKDKMDLIDLHPNNKVQTKLQVLNTFIQASVLLKFNTGWPDICYYKVVVRFEAGDVAPKLGLYRQSIVFDFKDDPKVVRHISLDILPKLEQGHASAAAEASGSALVPSKPAWVTTPPSTSPRNTKGKSYITSWACDFPSLATGALEGNWNEQKRRLFGNSDPDAVIDSDTGKIVLINGTPLHKIWNIDVTREQEIDFYLEHTKLTEENFIIYMGNFIEKEIITGTRISFEYKRIVDIKILPEYATSPDCLLKYDVKIKAAAYGKISVLRDIFAVHPLLKKMILENCYSVTISIPEVQDDEFKPSPELQKPNRKFSCPIIEKCKSCLVIAIGRAAASELLLELNSARELCIQFVFDPTSFDKLKSCLLSLNSNHLAFLFPNFEYTMPLLRILDGVGMQGEEEFTLNHLQCHVYGLLMGRKLPISTRIPRPPFLLLGGVSTGKTYFIPHCVAGLYRTWYDRATPRRILICTRSDDTADRFILEFWHKWLAAGRMIFADAKPLRVYDPTRNVDSVSRTVKNYCVLTNTGKKFRCPKKSEVLDHFVVITTFSACSELNRLGLENCFTHIFVDEVNQVYELQSIQPIALAGRDTVILLSGDMFSGHPKITNPWKQQLKHCSLIERLHKCYPNGHPFITNFLETYGNNEVIVNFLNDVNYQEHPLRVKKNQVAHPNYYPLTFYHVSESTQHQLEDMGGAHNMEEVHLITKFVEDLKKTWPESWHSDSGSAENDNIIVFTPSRSQAVALNTAFHAKGILNVRISLLSDVTGKKYKVVILSTTRSYTPNDMEILRKGSGGSFFKERGMVLRAIGSAKSLVATFGDVYSLWEYGPLTSLWRKFLTEAHWNNALFNFVLNPQKPLQTAGGAIIGEPVPRRKIPAVLSITSLIKNDSGKPENAEQETPKLLYNPNITANHGMNVKGLPVFGEERPLSPFSQIVQEIYSEAVPKPAVSTSTTMPPPVMQPSATFQANNINIYGCVGDPLPKQLPTPTRQPSHGINVVESNSYSAFHASLQANCRAPPGFEPILESPEQEVRNFDEGYLNFGNGFKNFAGSSQNFMCNSQNCTSNNSQYFPCNSQNCASGSQRFGGTSQHFASGTQNMMESYPNFVGNSHSLTSRFQNFSEESQSYNFVERFQNYREPSQTFSQGFQNFQLGPTYPQQHQDGFFIGGRRDNRSPWPNEYFMYNRNISGNSYEYPVGRQLNPSANEFLPGSRLMY